MEYLLEIALAIIGGLLAIGQYRARTHHTREIARLQSEAESRANHHAQEMAKLQHESDERKRVADEQNNRHAFEIQALKGESDQQKAQLDIIKEFAAGVPKNQESWQSVLNTMSARRLEGDKEIAKALRELAQASHANNKEINNLSDILEIQASAYGALRETIDNDLNTFVTSAAATHRAVDSQKQELQLVNSAIGNLTTRIDDLIAIDESHVLDEGTRHDTLRDASREHKEELVAINGALKTMNAILEKILEHMDVTDDATPVPEPGNTNNQVPDSAATVAAEETKP